MKIVNWSALCLPVLYLFVSSAIAETRKVGDWYVVYDAEYQEAFTQNASGSTAGIWCDLTAASCMAYVKSDRTCTDGDTIPMLISSSIGSNTTEGKCVKIPLRKGKDLQFNRIDDFDLFVRVAESGGEFAFAAPLRGAQFAVLRFGSGGATEALRLARTLPTRNAPSTVKGTRPRDQVL